MYSKNDLQLLDSVNQNELSYFFLGYFLDKINSKFFVVSEIGRSVKNWGSQIIVKHPTAISKNIFLLWNILAQ